MLLNDRLSIEVAFVGYSNSGKSSAINAITNVKQLTKVSSIPGNTKFIHLFEVTSKVRFVDFPGYGYSENFKNKGIYWYDVICQYLKKRSNLKGLILIMDVRHILKTLDYNVIKHALELNIPLLVLLNKSDKLSKSAQKIKLRLLSDIIKRMFVRFQFLEIKLFSSTKKYGVNSVKGILDIWLDQKN